MIEHIEADVTFTGPIKSWSFRGQFSAPPGITAVIGRNGSGKSFLAVEVPRYLLFGKKALRGAAGDYKELRAKGRFVLSGTRVEIERSAKRERLTNLDTGVVEAVGPDAVTAKVTELLGYPLAVFDFANASVQKQADALGKARPAERKEMIDRVVGLLDYEAIEKACREQAKLLAAQADGIAATLREPVAPVKPDNYSRSDDLQAVFERARKLRLDHDQLYNNTQRPVSVVLPPQGARVTQEQVDEAATVQAQADATLKERARLEAIVAKRPAGRQSEEDIAAGELRWAWEQERDRRGPAPTVQINVAEAAIARWADIAAAKRASDEQATCPNCGTEFRVGGKIPSEPALTKAQAEAELAAHRAWVKPLPPEPPVGPGPMSPENARLNREDTARWDAADEAEAALAALPNPTQVYDLPGLRAGLAAWQRHDAAMAHFEDQTKLAQAARQIYEDWLATNGEPMTDEQLDELSDRRTYASIYEAAVARYDTDKAEFAANSEKVVELKRRAEAYREGSKNLAGARAEFKAQLAPSLSRIASGLIHQMSAGELTSVMVDDEMAITVDGQKIETLSGAGETVANLALRIAFGQALAAGAFPVFIGDEIDSDADEQRRTATKQALLRLKEQLAQIILITHRAVDVADLVVDLDNPQEAEPVTG